MDEVADFDEIERRPCGCEFSLNLTKLCEEHWEDFIQAFERQFEG